MLFRALRMPGEMADKHCHSCIGDPEDTLGDPLNPWPGSRSYSQVKLGKRRRARERMS